MKMTRMIQPIIFNIVASPSSVVAPRFGSPEALRNSRTDGAWNAVSTAAALCAHSPTMGENFRGE